MASRRVHLFTLACSAKKKTIPFLFYIHRQSLQSTQKKEGRKGAQTLGKQGKKQPATSQKLAVQKTMPYAGLPQTNVRLEPEAGKYIACPAFKTQQKQCILSTHIIIRRCHS